MSRLRDLPLQRKLSLVVLSTCAAALLLACALLTTFDVLDFRRALARDQTVVADIVAANARAALVFRDDVAARSTLQALAAEPDLVAACLYDREGRRFAEYRDARRAIACPPQPGADGHRFEDSALIVARPVQLDGRRIGTIRLQVGLDGVAARLRFLGALAATVLVGSLLGAFLLSKRLQEAVTRPILTLADTARLIAERRDFGVRAAEAGRDEVGVLTTAFNEMLDGIEAREGALRTANEALQGEIAERRLAERHVEAQVARLELLHRITRAVSERQDLPSIFQVVVRRLEDDLPVDFGSILLYDQATDSFRVVSSGGSDGLAGQLAGDERSLRNEPGALASALGGDLAYEPDSEASAHDLARRFAALGLRSFVAAPLQVESRGFGVLLAARRRVDAFVEEERLFLRQVSEHVALAAHQAQLYGALQSAYDDLRQSQQAVMQQERLRALGEMASGIAHDINNAITPVMLYTELVLQEETALSDDGRHHLQIVARSVQDVAETVARLKDFYRPRASDPELAPVAVNGLLNQVLELTRARWISMPQQSGAVIHAVTELSSDAPTVVGVESELRVALTNLVFNAVDAMPAGGTLTLRTRVEPAPSEGESLRRVEIEVADSGIGMNAETLQRCLEPFFTTKGERGTGLGLAMVYGIMRRHGGDVEVASAEGRGTTVRLVFGAPITGLHDKRVDEQAPAALGRLRLLVVDDDPLVLHAVCRSLETDGHEVQAVSAGQEAIERFRTAHERDEPHSAVITDLGMPHVDGRQVANAVKAISPATPVILLTGWGQRILSEGDIPAHVDRVLAKPPKLSELRAALAVVQRRTGGGDPS